jgi:hypothetical protein
MNLTMLIRSAVATLATTTLLLAQSAAPAGPSGPRAATKPSPVSTERLQVRLAEVIAMLDEDDLTPEQRAMAKKKLEEIATRLRAAQAVPPSPAVAAPAAPMAPVAPMPPAELEVVEVAPGANARALRRARVVAPDGTRGDLVELEASTEAMPPQDPAPPKAPKAPRASRALKVLTPDAPPATSEKARSRVLYQTGDGELHVTAPVESKAETIELRRAADKMRAEVEALQPKVLRLREAAAEQAGEPSDVRSQWRTRVVESLEGDEPFVLQLDRARATEESARTFAVRARDQAEAMAKATKDSARTLTGRAGEARRAESRALFERARDQAAGAEAKVFKLQRSGNKATPSRKAEAEDDIRQIVDEMRAEMREIRELLQQLRKQSQANATKARHPGGGMLGGGIGASAASAPPVLGGVPLLGRMFPAGNELAPRTDSLGAGGGMSGAATRPVRSVRRTQERGK